MYIKARPCEIPSSVLTSTLFNIFTRYASFASLPLHPSLVPFLLLCCCGRRRRHLLQVLRLALKLAPVLQLHEAPPGAGVEPRHDAPLPVELLHLKAVQLDASADGNGRG